MIRGVPCIIMALLLALLFYGCSSQAPPEDENPASKESSKAQATVVVTQDFGKKLILEKEVETGAGTDAMAALKIVADVETKYGGGFVKSINGISSEYEGVIKSKRDWFIYINGIASTTGARDCVLRNGDVEHWDHRVWSYQQFIPAIIGDFPQPFLSGYQDGQKPAAVVYEEAFSADGKALAEKLKDYGVVEVSAVSCDRLSDEARQNSNLIIIALPDNMLISELNKAHKKLGFYAYFEQNKIIVLNAEGNPAGEFGEGCGLIQATQNPWNPRGVGAAENVAWMVTGAGADGVKSATGTLINNSDELHNAYAVVISDGKAVRIP